MTVDTKCSGLKLCQIVATVVGCAQLWKICLFFYNNFLTKENKSQRSQIWSSNGFEKLRIASSYFRSLKKSSWLGSSISRFSTLSHHQSSYFYARGNNIFAFILACNSKESTMYYYSSFMVMLCTRRQLVTLAPCYCIQTLSYILPPNSWLYLYVRTVVCVLLQIRRNIHICQSPPPPAIVKHGIGMQI